MKEKIIPLLSGFILTLLIILLSAYFFSLPPKIKPIAEELPEEASIEELKQLTQSLTNNGGLPKNVNSAEQGKANPFD